MNKPVSRVDLVPDTTARFTVDEFRRMNETGAFDDMKVELVDGALERMNASQGDHAKWQMRVGLRLGTLVSEDRIWGAVGIELPNSTVLECDVALLKMPLSANRWLVPDEILLVVEVSQTTTARDMGMKRSRYAAAGIPTYWVVDSERSVIHIYSEPIEGEYAAVHSVKFGAPLTVPGTGGTITID